MAKDGLIGRRNAVTVITELWTSVDIGDSTSEAQAFLEAINCILTGG